MASRMVLSNFYTLTHIFPYILIENITETIVLLISKQETN